MSGPLSYHQGELEVQRRAGVGSDGLAAHDMYRAEMPAGVKKFLSLQQLAVFSTTDSSGNVWASLRSGQPGFLRALDDVTVEVAGYSHPADPLLRNLAAESNAGMVVIHLAARHRVRLNGMAHLRPDGKIILNTQQVYGNCPQYIQARTVVGERDSSNAAAQTGMRLNAQQQRSIQTADTFFIATAHPQSGADASHRGGKPGFVRVEDETRLLIPDYSGNHMFNTLGNLAVNPHAGLIFPDFESGEAVQLSGNAKILWKDARTAQFHGAERLVQFDIEQVLDIPQATLLKFDFKSYSPTLP
jgi:predicted pyridoxine 5'-phosphate oxidase superfamily flavin-nucleotide-binding protein